MWESIILLAVYLLAGLLCLAVAGWGVITGQFLDVDGLFLVLVCLSLAAVFLGAFAISVWKGEFADVISKLLRPRPAAPEPSPEGSAANPKPSAQPANPQPPTQQSNPAQDASS